jgi:radical SAM superfamily enzyme YgiQ (UPF0313 family)
MILLVKTSVGRYDKVGYRLPLGLLYVTTYLRQHGVSARLLDVRVNRRWEKDLAEALPETEIVGLTCMIGPEVSNSLKMARLVKRKKPDVMVVFGGAHPTLVPEQALQSPHIDVVVRGEGERPMLDLAAGRPLSEIGGISYKRSAASGRVEVVHNPPQELLRPEEIPVPDYSLVDMTRYAAMSYGGERGLSIQGSRGCPYSCGFCYLGQSARSSWRGIPVETVLKNIDILVREHGARTIFFVDDNVAANPSRFLDLLKAIRQRPYHVNLAFQGIRIDSLERFSDDTFHLLQESGVRGLDVGVETLDERYLRTVDKRLRPAQILSTLERLEALDFNLKINFIAGLPGQTQEEIDFDVEQALMLEQKHKNSYILYNLYMPFPGTRMYPAALEAGFSPPEDFEGWSIFAGTSWMNKHSWFQDDLRNYLQNLALVFMFCNKNILTKVSNRGIRAIMKAYMPVARYRLEHRFFHLMIERKFSDFLD